MDSLLVAKELLEALFWLVLFIPAAITVSKLLRRHK